MDVERSDAMKVDGKSSIMYGRRHFERDTALSAWKRRWVVLGQLCVGTLMDTRFTKMPFVRREHDFAFCFKL